jgi:hypothetical protein
MRRANHIQFFGSSCKPGEISRALIELDGELPDAVMVTVNLQLNNGKNWQYIQKLSTQDRGPYE